MLYLKADTITEVTIGPAVAVGDGFTPVTNLVGASADEFELVKHGATTTTTIAGTLAAITGADGYYALDLSATDTNTEGRLVLLINDDSLILPIRHEFMVVAANVFDALFAVSGTDLLDVQVAGMDASVLTASAIASSAITAAKIASDAITAAKIASNAITAAKIATDAITAAKIAADAIGASELATDAIGSAELAQSAIDEIAGAIGVGMGSLGSVWRGYLRAETALTLQLGPFIAIADGSLGTGLTITAAEVELRKFGGAWAAKNESTNPTHDADGVYDALLDATDTNTVGTLLVKVNDAAAGLVLQAYTVMPADQYDALFSTGNIAVLVQSGGQSAAAYLRKTR